MNPRLLRSASILIGLLGAASALLSWAQPWHIVVLAGSFAGQPNVIVGGDVSAPAVAALALASAAGFAAMAISGPFFRLVLAGLELALGASLVLSSAGAIAAPVAAVAPAVTDVTGLDGAEAMTALIGSSSLTVWPYVSLSAGVLLVIVSVVILVTGRRWPGSGRKYEPVRFEPVDSAETSSTDTAVSDWDALSGGSDPTSR